jgi:hypothetical protein
MEATERPTAEKLRLAQAAFREFYHACFWFMRADANITEDDLPYIIQRLRADGGGAGFERAPQICR